MTKNEKALEVFKRLSKAIPNPKVELNFKTPFELLVATILAAQCTDKLVNTVTPALFKKYPTPKDMAAASASDIDAFIIKVTFHSNKAKNIQAASNMIMDTYHGIVPKTMEELDALPGVARKTANVVLGSAFGIASGIVIDTHGIRLSNKLGLTTEKDPVKIEQDLMKLIPKDKWIDFGHLLTLHGRYVCTARPHTCENCPLGDLCPEYAKNI
ncbi:MAG TPA: endonuclease III [Patescibacteria group bacterium]|nr:endonuclease III [Patescibacteria group bacterium]